ncbi:MAG: hypothetical protein A2Z27_01275 [candidate division Zixibacteria bacterium RBG_16_50_21]|nr:MAG: hypothetical protein A2Z27_01275 [candidate division Zixibacteria bacterium RBG_16_50_21]
MQQFAESLDYKPTPEQIERGMLDEDSRVRAAFASRAHHLFTPEQLERALTDENVAVRKYATLFKNCKPTPFQLERGLTDESPVIRSNIVQHFGDLLTPEQIKRGLKDDDVDVRHCFAINEDIDLSPDQIKSCSKDENIRIQLAIASRYNLNAYAKRHGITPTRAQRERVLMNEAEATRSKTVEVFPGSCNNSHVEISSRDYWFKIVEFLQQNWALIDSSSDGGCTVFFFGDTSGVFDRLTFPTVAKAEKALHRNGFARFADDKKAKEFIAIPQPPFKESTHPNGQIYSSGRYWVGD